LRRSSGSSLARRGCRRAFNHDEGRSELSTKDKPKTTITRTARGVVIERVGRLVDMDRSFDIEFWQAQPPVARFRAAQELVEHYLKITGAKEDEYRLDRTVERVQRWGG
jgi:hypothetical protein